ncbi:MAG TPA: hypothetical protein PKY82_25020 [Pyrinomonadaceae bacterium]|nr:hypothetical protein [Pyrinomonadaceae bacterium]
MKKYCVLFAFILTLFISGFGQKKTGIDPCLSKDPKVRVTSKTPCPSAPLSKKNNSPTLPKGTDDGETSDDSQTSDDSESNVKTNKKQTPPPKKTTKNNEDNSSMFFITIVHNGEKNELAYTQFENHDGNAMIENEHSGRMTFFYGGGNSVKNNDDFMFNGMIPTAAKGSYAFGSSGVMFSFKASQFPNVPVFLCESGGYEISAMPLRGGFVEGNFTANCIGEVHDDGTSEKYTMNGKFKLLRMM